MHFMMNPDAVYLYPIWTVGLLLIGLAVGGAVTIELLARRFLPLALRRSHNDVAAAMFSVIGVTYAVLLAFVAMLAWETFNQAKAASWEEAGAIRILAAATMELPGAAAAGAHAATAAYARMVVNTEWPAQAAGRAAGGAGRLLDRVARIAAGVPDGAGKSRMLSALDGLWRARQLRLLAAQSEVPGIVWLVLLLGGGLTIAFGSFLGSPSLAMHLAMSSALAVSGALVLLLVLALGHPFRGDFRVSTAPYVAVLRTITPPPGPGARPAAATIPQ
ncbi:MAG TPA: hypothetical protein VHY76_01580 [Acetobacteraceae bacterium]|nr:hypothetical protein [Acetobacteraceae bacterium]